MFLWIPRILTELRSEKFEWFDPSPIEPFNSDAHEGAGELEAEERDEGDAVLVGPVRLRVVLVHVLDRRVVHELERGLPPRDTLAVG